MSFEWIAAQLRHKNAHVAATCYSAFMPDIEERLLAELRALLDRVTGGASESEHVTMVDGMAPASGDA